MNKKILNLFVFAGVLLLAAIALPHVASATSLGTIIDTVATQLGMMAGGLAIIGFMIAGILFIAATGNPSLMSAAKAALIAAIIGTVVVVLSTGATGFVHTLTGV
jgi:hypothetical protein